MLPRILGKLLAFWLVVLALSRNQRGAVSFRIFGREPALWLAVIAAGLGLVVTFELPWMSADQAGLWVAIVNAVFGVAAAVLTRPIAPAAFTTLFSTGFALLAAYGLELPEQTVGSINVLVLATLMLVTREQVTPVPALARSTTS